MKKNIIAMALMLNMLSLNIYPALAADYSDLRADYWAYDSIQALSQQNIVSGYSDNTFKPDSPVTRAEFSTMLVKSLNQSSRESTPPANFRDVKNTFWAYDDINKVYSMGLVKGFPDGTFKLYAYITKAELLSIISSAAGLPQISQQESHDILSRFYDSNRIPSWAIKATAQTVKAGLAINYPQPNFLMPEKRVTRAEVAASLFVLRKNIGLEPDTQKQYGQTPAQNPYPQSGYGQNQYSGNNSQEESYQPVINQL